MAITKDHMAELEALIPDHKEALINYGADMYRSGIIKGAVVFGLGVGVAVATDLIVKTIKSFKKEKTES